MDQFPYVLHKITFAPMAFYPMALILRQLEEIKHKF